MANVTSLTTQINTLLQNSPTAENAALGAGYTKAVDKSNYTVYDIIDLPSPSINTGRIMYVSRLNKFYFSDGRNWVSNLIETASAGGVYVFGGYSTSTWTTGDYAYDETQLTTLYYPNPTLIQNDPEGWTDIRGGYGLKFDGTLWDWGAYAPGRKKGMIRIHGTWKSFDGQSTLTAAIKSDGTLWTWGSNYRGELGTGNLTSRSSPGTTAGGGNNWVQVSVTGNIWNYVMGSMAAIKSDGTLWTWGSNYHDEGTGSLPFYKGLLGQGVGDSTGHRSSPGTVAGGGTDWKQVSCGSSIMAAVKTDGTLWTWGGQGLSFFSGGYDFGQLGAGLTILTRSSPGTIAGGGTTWSQVSCGGRHSAAIKTDGTLWTWGANDQYSSYGALGDGTQNNSWSPITTAGGGTNWSQVTAGYDTTVAIKTDGTLWTWGYNGYQGDLGTGSTKYTAARSSPGTTTRNDLRWTTVCLDRSMSYLGGYNETVFGIAK